MTIDRDFFVQFQGRDFVLFAGLQDGATQAGLKSVVTTIVQIPTAENGHFAVMKARVEFEDGRVFEAVGDASPQSVGRMIVPHLLRMAETRAVGRAYRWALNIGATMKEELGGPDEERATEGHPAAANGQGRTRASMVSHRSQTPPAVEPGREAAAPACEACGVVLSPALAAASQKHFRKNFCEACGKAHLGALRAEVEGAAA